MIPEIPKTSLKTHLAPTTTSNAMITGSTRINAPTRTTTPPAISSGTDTDISKFTIESISTTTTELGKQSFKFHVWESFNYNLEVNVFLFIYY